MTVSLETVLCTVSGYRFRMNDWETLRYSNNMTAKQVGKQEISKVEMAKWKPQKVETENIVY